MRTHLEDAPARDEYFKLLELHEHSRVDYNDRKWETAKFFEGVYTALIAAALVAAANAARAGVLNAWGWRLALAILPLCAAIAVSVGLMNMKRESRLLFLEELQVFKLAKALRLNRSVQAGDRWLPMDPNLLGAKWQDCSYGIPRDTCAFTPEAWAAGRLREHRFYKLFRVLFILEAIVALGLAVLFLIGLPSAAPPADPAARAVWILEIAA